MALYNFPILKDTLHFVVHPYLHILSENITVSMIRRAPQFQISFIFQFCVIYQDIYTLELFIEVFCNSL